MLYGVGWDASISFTFTDILTFTLSERVYRATRQFPKRTVSSGDVSLSSRRKLRTAQRLHDVFRFHVDDEGLLNGCIIVLNGAAFQFFLSLDYVSLGLSIRDKKNERKESNICV